MTKEDRQGVLSSSLVALLVKFCVLVFAVFFVQLMQRFTLEEMAQYPIMVMPYLYHHAVPHAVSHLAIGYHYVRLRQMRVYLWREYFYFLDLHT